MTRWVAGLSGADRDALLIGLLEGDDPLLRAETLRRAGPDRLEGTGLRTTAELLDEAAAQRERRELAERDRRAALAAESAHRVEVARRERLARLVAEGDGAWARVAARIAEKAPPGYDAAVDLLGLQDACDPDRLCVPVGGVAARARAQGDVRRAARARRTVSEQGNSPSAERPGTAQMSAGEDVL